MKRVLLITLAIAFSFVILGCSSPTASKSGAKEIVTQYKSQLYNISDYNKFNEVFAQDDALMSYIEGFKGYMTEEGYQRFVANRISAIPLNACNKGKFSLRVTSIEFNKITEESNKIIMEYTLTFGAAYAKTGITHTSVETGEVTLIKENNTWKIDHDWLRVADLIEKELGMAQGTVINF